MDAGFPARRRDQKKLGSAAMIAAG